MFGKNLSQWDRKENQDAGGNAQQYTDRARVAVFGRFVDR